MGTGHRSADAQSNTARGGAIGDAYRPESVAELRAIVASAERIRVLGTRHSFNAIGESDALVSLDRLPPDVTVAAAASRSAPA